MAGNPLQLLIALGHDMRSPLSSIQMLVERLKRGDAGPVTPLQERQLAIVFAATFGLHALVADVIDLAQGGARLFGPAPRPFSLKAVVSEALTVVRPMAEEKGLRVRFSSPECDVRVGHAGAIHRVLLNLVTNAIKFTHDGTVVVELRALDAKTVRFTVTDDGRGMPPHVVAAAAHWFANESASPSTAPFSSAGFGLAFCHQLVVTMGGRLVIEQSGPYGTDIRFDLVVPSVDA